MKKDVQRYHIYNLCQRHTQSFEGRLLYSPVTFNVGYTSWKLNSKYKVTARKLPKDTELEKKSFRHVTPLSAHTFLMQHSALIGLAADDRQRKKKRERNNNIIICQHLIHAHNEPRSQFRVITWDAPRKWPRNSFLGHMLYGCPCSFPGKESCAFSPIWVLKKPLGVLNYDNQMAKSLHFSPRF